MPVTIGIDPGLTGAIVVIENGSLVEQYSMPVMKVQGETRINESMLGDILLLHVQDGINAVAVERQHIRPRQRGGFKIADHHGFLRGIASMLDCEVYNPRPQEWQEIIEMAELSTRYLIAPTSRSPKARSIAAAEILLPDVDLTPGLKRKPQHGIADAALIALWAERRYYEE